MRFLLLIFAISASMSAMAAVADSSSNGFTVKSTLAIEASPAEVYSRLIHNIGDWWNPEHTFSHDSHNLSIEEKPMGCFCEKLANGGVRHMEVIYFERGRVVRMNGLLGPLQGLGGAGVLTIELSAAGEGTKFEATYSAAGYLPAGMNTWATPVDSMLTEQFTRLKNYIEHGAPVAPKRP
jgi:hypothetical protein